VIGQVFPLAQAAAAHAAIEGREVYGSTLLQVRLRTRASPHVHDPGERPLLHPPLIQGRWVSVQIRVG
jgi:hypothetical protein